MVNEQEMVSLLTQMVQSTPGNSTKTPSKAEEKLYMQMETPMMVCGKTMREKVRAL